VKPVVNILHADDGPDAEDERAARLLEAQGHAAELFAAVTELGILRPGVLDSEASAAVGELASTRFGVTRHWHKRIVRSGPNTLQPYQDSPPDRAMTGDDIVFGDFGPIFDGWEADFGRTWVLGDDPVKLRLRDDLSAIFAAGKRYFDDHPDVTGEQLYDEVVRLTADRGWVFGNFHCGHLVGEFPHQNFDGDRRESRITPGNTRPMRGTDPSGRVAHWILEVHLIDPDRGFGGFYEQLLTLA
jgi:Xaa-Pro aminopeptidase